MLADSDKRWTRRLVAALEGDGVRVTVVEHGAPLTEALTTSRDPADMVVMSAAAGTALLATVEAAAQQRSNAARIAILCDTFLAADALAIMNRLGVSDVIERDRGVEAASMAIQARLFADRRSEPRVPVEVIVTIRIGALTVAGRAVDLSSSGAKIVASARKLVEPVPVGEVLELAFESGPTVRGIVRRSQLKKQFLGRKHLLGVQFDASDELKLEIRRLIDGRMREVDLRLRHEAMKPGT